MPTVSKKDVSAGLVEVNQWHRARAKECKAKISQKGDQYYNIAFESPSGQFLGYDVAMLEGPGNGIGIAKLVALGACRDIGEEWDYDLPDAVEGKECYIYLVAEPYEDKKTGEMKRGTKVDISQGRCGYLPLTSPPVGFGYSDSPPVHSYQTSESAKIEEDDSDIPF